MKTILLFVLFNLLVKCTPVPFDPPINNNYSKYCIAIQPFDEFKYEELESIKREILSFFKGEVIILEPESIPRSYYIPQIGQYFADSILAYLSVNHAKRINEMVGITHQNICTLKESKSKDLPAYFDQGIFGLGYQPGN